MKIITREFYCDGMPTQYGCPEHIPFRRWTKEGIKPNGWLFTYAVDDTTGKLSMPLFPLYFCPSCALVVLTHGF